MSNQKNVTEEPLLASTVRDLRQLIADIRTGFGAAAGIAGLSMWALKFGSKGRKNRS
jgi:mTERF domain-containing protein